MEEIYLSMWTLIIFLQHTLRVKELLTSLLFTFLSMYNVINVIYDNGYDDNTVGRIVVS